MGLFGLFSGLKSDEAKARELIKEYVATQYESLMLSWLSMKRDMEEFKELDKRELLREETAKIANEAAEYLKKHKIKPPTHTLSIVRETLNDMVLEMARPYIKQFVTSYRNPYQPWPVEANIPPKDMEKIVKILEEHGITLDVLYYDMPEERIRRLLEQYGVRRRLSGQDAENWSRSFSYTQDDLITLAAVMKEKQAYIQAIDHLLGDLRMLVKQELMNQQDGQFQRSFAAANPDLPPNPTKEEWVKAYVRTFKNDMDYLDYLIRMARPRGTLFTKEELQKLITAELRQAQGNKPF